MTTAILWIGIAIFAIGIILGIIYVAGSAVDYREKLEKWEKSNKYNDEKSPKPVKEKVPKYPIFIIIVGIIIIILSRSFYIVPSGYTGVRTTFGMIDQESCMPGFNGLTPFVQKISLVNNKQQDLRFEDRVWAETSEQTVVYMENVQVTYQIVPEASAWIYANVENWIEDLVDVDITSSALKSAARSLDASIVTDRSTIEPLAVECLQTAVDEKYGENRVLIKNIIINNMDFEDSYNEAIAKKSQAIQEQQEQEIRNKTMIDKAAAEAEAARQEAQGEADAELICAEGKAKANETISKSITDMTQMQDIIDAWNGVLPKYNGGDNSMFGIFEQESVSGNRE